MLLSSLGELGLPWGGWCFYPRAVGCLSYGGVSSRAPATSLGSTRGRGSTEFLPLPGGREPPSTGASPLPRVVPSAPAPHDGAVWFSTSARAQAAPAPLVECTAGPALPAPACGQSCCSWAGVLLGWGLRLCTPQLPLPALPSHWEHVCPQPSPAPAPARGLCSCSPPPLLPPPCTSWAVFPLPLGGCWAGERTHTPPPPALIVTHPCLVPCCLVLCCHRWVGAGDALRLADLVGVGPAPATRFHLTVVLFG